MNAWQKKREIERQNEAEFECRTSLSTLLKLQDNFQMLKTSGIYPPENFEILRRGEGKPKHLNAVIDELVDFSKQLDTLINKATKY